MRNASIALRWAGRAALLGLVAAAGACDSSRIQGEENAVLTQAPNVPPPITRRHPTKVIVHLETREVTGRLADGVEYTYWTFGGAVPGNFIRVREGDLVEIHIANHPGSHNPHNIDLHAVTGPGGGASSSFVAPGQTATFAFRALNPGLYVYHCATAPVGMHLANGMYGLILVEPRAGLPHVDREYYVMQGEVYTRDGYGVTGLQPFDMRQAIAEHPAYVVFNGAVGSLTGDHALTANVGETVRFFVGNGGPNLISSFHIIGEILDRVYQEAGSVPNQNIQTTLIPAGGAAIVEIKLQVPGTFLLVDHSIFRAFNKGALGQLKVSGPQDSSIYSGRIAEGIYHPEGGAVQSVPMPVVEEPRAHSPTEQAAFGRRIFEQNCSPCHQPDGRGIPGAFPPLAHSDFLNADFRRAIGIVLGGKTGPITVNGATFNSVMPAQALTDDNVANVLTYVFSQWGNSAVVVTPDQVRAVRATLPRPNPAAASAH